MRREKKGKHKGGQLLEIATSKQIGMLKVILSMTFGETQNKELVA